VENVDLERLPGLFQDHDIVWVPSMCDSFPLTCLEAMTCGKAVVEPDVGGLPEMVNHGETGLIFPVGDAEALSRLTGELCDPPELRQLLSRNAQQYTETFSSVDAIYAKTVKLYELALARKIGGLA
jgi:glycosyltransferase involved in cell wall biosynthesis